MDYERLAYCCRERSKREMEDATQITLEDAATAITGLLARAEAAEARAEKAERERDAAVSWVQKYTESIDRPCVACKHNTGDYVCTAICDNCGPMGTKSCKWEFDFSGELKED